MKQFLEYVVPNLVNHPEDVVITEEEKDGMTVLTIKVHADDVGRVIGKSGKVIKSLRQIVRVMAIKQGVRAAVDVADSQGQRTVADTGNDDSSSTSDDMDMDITDDDDLLMPDAEEDAVEESEVEEEAVEMPEEAPAGDDDTKDED